MKIYLVVNLNGERVGIVQNDGDKLYLTNKDFINEFDNIDDIFNYTESNKLHLLDGEGDSYNRSIHNELIKNISKIGIGYFCR